MRKFVRSCENSELKESLAKGYFIFQSPQLIDKLKISLVISSRKKSRRKYINVHFGKCLEHKEYELIRITCEGKILFIFQTFTCA